MLAQLISLLLVSAFIAACSYGCGTIACESKADKMALPHSYGLIEGCMVKVDDRWVPLDSYRVID